MSVLRTAFVAGLLATVLASCGPALPPAGNYASVLGRVTDAASGAGVANATVSVNIVSSVTTDASGSFRIVSVPTGPWQYSVQAPGYVGVSADNPPPLMPGEARTITIALTHR